MNMKASWDQLPDDLLLVIADLLSWNPADYIGFSFVCKSWHAVATKESYPLARQMPWLMLAEDNPNTKLRRFHSPSDDMIYTFPLPEASGRKCIGSIGGWVVTVGKYLKVRLLHPFTRLQIQLPSLDELETYFCPLLYMSPEFLCNIGIVKVCLSSNPWKEKGNKLTALVIYCGGYRLAFSRPDDPSWTSIDNLTEPVTDAIFYEGHFYAVDCHGVVVVLDLIRCKAEKLTYVRDYYSIYHSYLVESMGDLLVVLRSRRPLDDSTETFFVYKLVNISSREEARLEPVMNLGNRSLFVGLNNSLSVTATEMKGCRENCIYFTDDNINKYDGEVAGHDMGVFNLEDGSIEPHFRGKSLSAYSPPIWIAHFLWWQ